MTGAPEPHDATTQPTAKSLEPIRYPTNHLLAVIDTREQAMAAITALTSGGFLESEIQFGTGRQMPMSSTRRPAAVGWRQC